MAYPNTLIFVDFPSNDPEATARFYAEVFGWQVEGRPAGTFHRIVKDKTRALGGFVISDDDNQDRILQAAAERGATILWRNHYWGEFNGFCDAFVDPWGTEIILWGKAGDNPTIPEGFTSG